MTGRQTDGLLRCGACWRDVFGTSHGESWHRVFDDGSMRCWAPESLAKINDMTPSFISTFIVHATEDRMQLIATALDQRQQMKDHAESRHDWDAVATLVTAMADGRHMDAHRADLQQALRDEEDSKADVIRHSHE